MPRIDPSRRGVIIETRAEFSNLTRSPNIQKQSKNDRKSSKFTPHSYQLMLGLLVCNAYPGNFPVTMKHNGHRGWWIPMDQTYHWVIVDGSFKGKQAKIGESIN